MDGTSTEGEPARVPRAGAFQILAAGMGVGAVLGAIAGVLLIVGGFLLDGGIESEGLSFLPAGIVMALLGGGMVGVYSGFFFSLVPAIVWALVRDSWRRSAASVALIFVPAFVRSMVEYPPAMFESIVLIPGVLVGLLVIQRVGRPKPSTANSN